MLQEVHAASQALSEALDRYASACSSLQNSCLHGTSLNNVSDLKKSVANERKVTAVYHEKLKEAELSMRRIHNSPMLPPINSLPPEIIATIFHLVQIKSTNPCSLERTNAFGALTPACPKYPDILSHVCSRWRQIALTSNHLWSHADIALSCPLGPKLLSRAQACVTRAGRTPLDLHILDPGTHSRYQQSASKSDPSHSDDTGSASEAYSDDDDESDYTDEFDFPIDLGSIFPRQRAIRIIELVVPCKPHESHFSALRDCLAKCLPGNFQKLGIYGMHKYAQQIAPEEKLDRPPGLALQIPKAQLESILAPLPVLHASGMYPY